MSYTRFGPASDVYVYDHVDGHLECCGCRLGDICYRAETAKAMAAHLRQHITAGHTVPDDVIPQLLETAAVEDVKRAQRRRQQGRTTDA